MTTSDKTHYVYKITNLNPIDAQQFYIGVHSDKNPDSINDGYMGSSKYLDKAMKEIGSHHFKKEILSVWDTRAEASLEEIRLHEYFDVAKNGTYFNKTKAKANGFTTEGLIYVKNIIDNTNELITTELFHKDKKRYKFMSEGKVRVIDTRTNTTKSIEKAEFKKHDYYNAINKNKINVLDTRNGQYGLVTVEDYYQFNYYKFVTSGKVQVLDLRDNINKLVTKEEYKNNDYYEHITKGMMTAKTKDGNNIFITTEEYNSGEYNGTATTGLVPVYDLRDNTKKMVSKVEFNNNTYYISTQLKTIKIYNSFGKLMYISDKTFRTFCKEKNIPESIFADSFKNGGELIYQNINNRTLSRITKNGNIKYKGWYAIKS